MPTVKSREKVPFRLKYDATRAQGLFNLNINKFSNIVLLKSKYQNSKFCFCKRYIFNLKINR